MNRPFTPSLPQFASAVLHRVGCRVVYACVVLLALASASISALAQSFVDTDPALYRCAVLGDTRACHQPAARPAVWYEEWVELGPTAQRLRYLGADTEDAIAQARLRGEQPQRHIVKVTRIPLTAEQAHARGTGQRIVPDEERHTLSVTPAHEQAPLLHNDWSASLLALPSKCPSGTPAKDSVGSPASGRCSGVTSRAR
jgi:hypothetical protein